MRNGMCCVMRGNARERENGYTEKKTERRNEIRGSHGLLTMLQVHLICQIYFPIRLFG